MKATDKTVPKNIFNKWKLLFIWFKMTDLIIKVHSEIGINEYHKYYIKSVKL